MHKREEKKKMILEVITILIIVLGVIIYWNIPYSPFKVSYDNRAKERLESIADGVEVCTQEEVNRLPKMLQKHCEDIGLVGSKKHKVVHAVFKDTRFVFDDAKGIILPMEYDLWLFNDEQIFRSAYCKSKLHGIPFDGEDYMNEEQQIGGMKGIIGKAIQIFDQHNEQMYTAGLITWFIEGMILNPSTLLSQYVSYEEIDDRHIKVTISYNGRKGSGVLVFDDTGNLSYFESDERQVEEVDGVVRPLGWRAEWEGYEKKDGLFLPKRMKAITIYPDKEVVYFDSNHIEVTYYK